ncbi:HK97-gp10 family putative phage morphogenesis protein [Aquincola sp. J276]|uniref:HK97-gp10 family putative phage morphogenesis protein n=1 Tax=Aquincola sp. J276 TaxID=2898432 RepID=UPI002151636A|nr:HK97-gp10 family putative phage morphogenesis protein [Aquincola sp. J276]MCR5864653.1 HK97 gp10 family phage protein [Aquincola sp. J276]
MAADLEVKVSGLSELREALAGLPDKLRRRALRNALAAGARLIRDAARATVPVLAEPTPRRASGTVRNAISVRTSKAARREGNVGVYVNVRPAKGAARGAKSASDPFYWRFLEFGTDKMAARPYLRPAAQAQAQAALGAFSAKLGPQLDKLNANPKDPL